MSRLRRTMLALAAALAAAAVVSVDAGATSFTISRAGSISMPSILSATFEWSGGVKVECRITMNGSLMSGPIEAVSGATVGSLSEMRIAGETCSGGSIERPLGLPWTLKLSTTLGGLPNEMSGMLWTIETFELNFGVFFGLVNCLFHGGLGVLLAVTRTRTAGSYTTESFVTLASPKLTFVRGSEACPAFLETRATWNLIFGQTITVR